MASITPGSLGADSILMRYHGRSPIVVASFCALSKVRVFYIASFGCLISDRPCHRNNKGSPPSETLICFARLPGVESENTPVPLYFFLLSLDTEGNSDPIGMRSYITLA